MYDLLSLQHGFRENRSCETQLIMLVEDLARKAGNGKQTDLILLDFSKEFNKVNHSKLIWKLHNYGIRSNVLSWIRAFLGDRTQRVVVWGEESDSVPVTSRVPKGSVLGPILFLVYINDLPENVASQVRLFADITAIMYLTMEGANDSSVLQQDLDRLSVWESDWDMEFNPSKCLVVQVTGYRKPINAAYRLHGVILETVTCARYLGVDISSNQFGGSHTGLLALPSRLFGFVKRNIGTKMSGVREAAYTALGRPQLEYAAAIWDPNHDDKIKQIEKVQRRAAR